ncbi:MAG: class I SAM-dependent methyltransferase [Lentimicrobiaceae bacterium]|nr:class I SAM-dependent methyltransferase [Lentimicrobiaceae bacterium]
MLKKIYKRIFSEKTRINIRIFLDKNTAFFYIGNKFECNCCGKTFRKFKSKGNILRKNVKCPYCGSLERTRLLLFYLEKETNIFTKKDCKVLHFAPEQTLLSKFSQRTAMEYVDADINPNYANYIFDIEEIPYPNEYFDYIICSHVLGHVSHEQKAIEELFRVLKWDGQALIMTLIDKNRETTLEEPFITTPKDRLKYYSEQDLARLHGLDFGQRLSHCFKVEEIDYRTTFEGALQKRFSLGDGAREIIFSCRK